MLDFNDTAPVPEPDRSAQRDEIRTALIAKLDGVLTTLFPAGRKRKELFLIGDVLGSPGDSLEVVLDGEKIGLWTDRATGDGGDIFDLIAAARGINAHTDFPRVLDAASDLLGRATVITPKKSRKEAPVDDLGPATAKWDYIDASGKLIAVVYRYDPPGSRKEFRPWDARRRKMTPPDPRPLYNQPGIAAASQVVLVEGEKCAQALINLGITATTAMHGANAPVEKTDWSPLSGKAVVIWPDHDNPGREYALAAAQALLTAGATSCDVLIPPSDEAEGWDAADAIAAGFDVGAFLAEGPRASVKPAASTPPENSVWGTDDSLALDFTRRFASDWRYCAVWGKWMHWEGRRWKNDDTELVLHMMRGICREMALKATSDRLSVRLSSTSALNAMERQARTDRRHAATTGEWDANSWLLNTPGGVVDLKTGRMRSHDRADRMTKVTTATPGGDCPTWRKFLIEVTGGDRSLQDYLQRMAGYCLTGSTREHALLFLYGTGANGKSVFLNTLASILGDYATNAPIDTFMETRSDRHPTDLAGLRGARFVSSIETEQGRRWAESKVKNLTGGDKVAARFMYQDFFEYWPQFKLLIAGNHKPALRNVDEAMKRRLHLIPFTVTIPEDRRDGQLPAKLLAERDGILAWMLDGCLAWQQSGLKPPASVVDATGEYFEAEDAVGRWIEESCVRLPSAKSLTAELFSDWKRWADAAGEFVGTQRRFSDTLLHRGVDKWRNSCGLRGFQGIGLKAPPTSSYSPYIDD